jgi:hypothetical protein
MKFDDIADGSDGADDDDADDIKDDSSFGKNLV